ncbi:uncharacterized protein STEHIDRAFT_46182, partial [Stereum hirsutum FP-91666 SS1]|uniref:uncharacterized protein n=1 Tax=Stereum hirsutum (strain FP-91666) TaxID=721885 RepID=UPI000440B3F4
DRAHFLNHLVEALHERFERTGRLNDLDESIAFLRDVLLLPAENHERDVSLQKLATGLGRRFTLTGYPNDFDESIHLHRQVLRLRVAGHPRRAAALHDLATDLMSRFRGASSLDYLDESISLNREALLIPGEGRARAFSLHNLSVCLVERFEQTGQLEDLEESIDLIRNAVLLHPVGHPRNALPLRHLGICLDRRFRRMGDPADLAESIELFRESIALCPVGHPERACLLEYLGIGLKSRFLMTGHPEDFSESISAFEQAASDEHSKVVTRLSAAREWAYFTRTRLAQSSLHAFTIGVSLIPRPLSTMPFVALQYSHLSVNHRHPEFVSDAASHAIQMGQLALATEMIEQGRGLLWSELRGLRTPMERLRANSGPARDPFGPLLAEKHRLLENQKRIIERIREIPTFEAFLCRPSFSVLQAAAKHGPVITVNLSEYRSDALIILEHGPPALVPTDDNLHEIAQKLSQQLTEARAKIKTAPKHYNIVLRTVLENLWELVVSPVITKLKELRIPEMSRIFWCPTSVLSTLPLHAAGPTLPGSKSYLPDLYISSYTPTLTSLITAFNTGESFAKPPRLLLIGQSTSLPRVKEEANEVLYFMIKSGIMPMEEPEAIHDTARNPFLDYDWLHIASHGTLIPGKPFSSYFSLNEDTHLTLLDLIQLHHPNANFAFLSACHAAEYPVGSIHDEAIHLAAAVQFCGFRSVVGPMWEMADVDGPDLVKDFYSYVFESDVDSSQWNKVGLHARALASATKKMRERKGMTLERWGRLISRNESC